jgi:DNA end-binding protein Ku
MDQYKDEYKTELMKIIKAKAGGKKVTVKKVYFEPTRKDDLFEQLRASLSRPAKKRAS